jgi:hypothetical protein
VVLLIYSLVTILQMVLIGGQPATARAGFEMLQANRLIGLLRLDVLTLLVMPLYYPLFLALHLSLERLRPAAVTLASLLAFAGVTLVLATPSAFSFVTLSDKFALAASEAERSMLLAAGEAVLASDMWHGSGPLVGGILVQTAAVVFSAVMLRSGDFGRATSLVGLGMHSLDLAHVLIGLFVPAAGAALLFVAGPLYLVWFPLLARDLFRLGRGAQAA